MTFGLIDEVVNCNNGSGFVVQAGVGEKVRADARIIFEGIKNSTTQTRTQEANYVVWQKQLNQGTSQETLLLPSFTGPTKPSFTAPGGLSAQIAEGDFKSQINSLSAQPGMGYLNDLAARKDVNWQPVKLAFEQWNYKQEGLTPAGAALLAAAVAWALPPEVGANLIGAKQTYWYNFAKQPYLEGGAYFGQWSLEAAAAAKVFGMDDSLCLGHRHYPGDFLRPHGPTTHPERPDVLLGAESAQTAPQPERQRGWLSRLLGQR